MPFLELFLGLNTILQKYSHPIFILYELISTCWLLVFISIFVPSILKLRVKHPQFSATGAWEIKNERWSTARSFGTDQCSKNHFTLLLYQITVLSSCLFRNPSIDHLGDCWDQGSLFSWMTWLTRQLLEDLQRWR